MRSADEVLQRLLFLGVCMGGLVGLVVAACQTQIAAFFTQDVAVVTQVWFVLFCMGFVSVGVGLVCVNLCHRRLGMVWLGV